MRSIKEKVIIDGDWGGDELQLAAVLLAAPEKVKVIGATACFGNVNHNQVFKNGRDILHFLNASHIPVYPGSKQPSDSSQVIEDGAHGSNGLGNVTLKTSPAPVQKEDAVDFIIRQLNENLSNTITITASGPLTNIARAIIKDPEAMKKVKEIVIMGGGVAYMKAHDIPQRKGNITPKAEFNFHSAPNDADFVLNSGLPITLLPMNCTYQFTFTPEMRKEVDACSEISKEVREKLINLISAPAEMEKRKFNISPVMNDVNCALYILSPESYNIENGKVSVSGKNDDTYGESSFINTSADKSHIRVAMGIKDTDKIFKICLQSYKKVLNVDRCKLSQKTQINQSSRDMF